jgi:hypothetical protein
MKIKNNNFRKNKTPISMVYNIIRLVLLIAIGLVFRVENFNASAQIETSHNIYLPSIRTSQSTQSRVECGASGGDWSMAAANPERTSWTAEEVCGDLGIIWYRPIEAYISQNTQIIAAEGLIYLSTAKGLYALNPDHGSVVWRYDTELPLGNSPTVSNGTVYVGGHDHNLYALNAQNGHLLWSFNGAQSGYDANPLVADGRVILGNRDGSMYAIGAQGTPQQGQLLWKFETGGPIHLAAAYKNGVVYFGSNDNHAYAVRATDGSQVWKSAKLPGDGLHSYWPVIYQDMVIFSLSPGYRAGVDPGTRTIINPEDDTAYGSYNAMEIDGILPEMPDGTLIGPELPPQSWSNGKPVIDVSSILNYSENNPAWDAYQHKPWRRTYVILNQSDGHETRFDTDGDGYSEYMPYGHWGTASGNRYPPIIGPDGLIYGNNVWQKSTDSQGKVMGWLFGTRYMSIAGGQAAIAEPQALSGGGSLIYRNLCCDRVGELFDTVAPGIRTQSLWTYVSNLSAQAPGYDDMWMVLEGLPRLHGWYTGATDSVNGVYHNHGDQNPIIPYQGKLFVHRSNAIIAYGSGTVYGKQPLLPIQPGADNTNILTTNQLKDKLEQEVQKILTAGLLRPGYYNNTLVARELSNYFENPGETLYTLTIAYPYLSTNMQAQVMVYLEEYFTSYFDPIMYATTGWSAGAARESMPIPDDLLAALAESEPLLRAGSFSWSYPPHNYYSLWKYAQIVPGDALTAYNLAKSTIQVPVPDMPVEDYFLQRPYEHNAYMTGYIGFLNLQDLAGMSQQDSQLRSQVTAELDRLLNLRWQSFSKDSYWGIDNFNYRKHLDIARNFMYLVPELADYFRQNISAKVNEAVSEYEYVAPYWFVTRYEGVIGEGVMSNLYNSWAMFTAKALIQQAPFDELVQFVDAPAFERGDLYYIQKLALALRADGGTAENFFTPDD